MGRDRDVPRVGEAPHVTEVGVGVHQINAWSIARLQELGVRLVRFTIYWNLWTEKRGYPGDVVMGVRALRLARLQPLLVLHAAPGSGTVSGFRSFARTIATFWPDADLQLFNEVDAAFPGSHLFGGAKDPLRSRARRYASMLREVVPALKEVSVGKIVTAGIALEPEPWLEQLGDAPRDVDAVHCYGFPVIARFTNRVKAARAFGKPVWVTEFGMTAVGENGEPTGGVIPPDWKRTPEAVDAWHLENVRDPVLASDAEALCDRMYVHVLQQNGNLGYDLVRGSGGWRPAGGWLKARMNPPR